MTEVSRGRTITPTKHAADVAEAATAVALAAATVLFPPAALLEPIRSQLVKRLVERPQRILVEQLKKGGVAALTEEELQDFTPMAYRLFEAAKQGEFEHNLRVLGSYIAGELSGKKPDAGNVLSMAKRIEGLTDTDLNVVALVDKFVAMRGEQEAPGHPTFQRWFLNSTNLAQYDGNTSAIDAWTTRQSLAELAARGLLVVEGAMRWGKAEEYYLVPACFTDLVTKARGAILDAAKETPRPVGN